jgi:hypothetical protein
MNLNDYKIPNADGPDESLSDFSTESDSGDVQIYFRNLESELVKRIERSDIVVGCIAWLTSEKIISALAKKQLISIIVQKEDFLRPDIDGKTDWKDYLSSLYLQLNNGSTRYDKGFAGTALHMMSYCGDPAFDAIRCVGNHNRDKKPAFPRMHNKFLVFCYRTESSNEQNEIGQNNFSPYEVWTGSFNFTKNASNSFENAVILRDKKLWMLTLENLGKLQH